MSWDGLKTDRDEMQDLYEGVRWRECRDKDGLRARERFSGKSGKWAVAEAEVVGSLNCY